MEPELARVQGQPERVQVAQVPLLLVVAQVLALEVERLERLVQEPEPEQRLAVVLKSLQVLAPWHLVAVRPLQIKDLSSQHPTAKRLLPVLRELQTQLLVR